MTTDNEKILDRINKLMAKTVENGCTPEEAAAAAAKVQELIAKYHIDLRDTDTEEEEVGACLENMSRNWQGQLAVTLAANMCCEVIVSRRGDKKTLVFMGRDTDLQAVLSLYDAFNAAIKAGAREEKKANSGRNIETSYALGFVSAVGEEMGKQCKALALVVPEDVTAKLHEQFPNMRTRRTSSGHLNGKAFANGRAAGREAAGTKSITA